MKTWAIEQRGLEQVSTTERYGNSRGLFSIWFAANIGLLSLVYGVMIRAEGLPFWQGVLVSLVGSTSFLLVGFLGVAGKNLGYPMLVIARRPFGSYGNILPSLVSWVNLLGWETIIWVTATHAILYLIQSLSNVQPPRWGIVLIFLALGLCTFVVALYGHAAIVKVQTGVSAIFGLTTFMVVIRLMVQHRVHFPRMGFSMSIHGGFLPSLAIIVVGTGLSWVTTASDYTRYLPSGTSSLRITLVTFLGASIPLIALIVSGMILTPSLPGLATAADPLRELGAGLSGPWMVMFWMTAAFGLLTENILAIYSSGLTLQTMHVRIARPWTAVAEFLLTGIVGITFILHQSPFLASFESFLSLVGGTLAPWAGVMLMDLIGSTSGSWMLRRKWAIRTHIPGHSDGKERRIGMSLSKGQWGSSRFGVPAVVSYLLGVITTLLFVSSPVWSGPLSNTVVGQTQLGFLMGGFVSLVCYGLFRSGWPSIMA